MPERLPVIRFRSRNTNDGMIFGARAEPIPPVAAIPYRAFQHPIPNDSDFGSAVSGLSLPDMATKLAKPLKREIVIGTQPYIVTLDPDGMKLTEKGHRKGIQLAWKDLLSGQAALSAALNASLAGG